MGNGALSFGLQDSLNVYDQMDSVDPEDEFCSANRERGAPDLFLCLQSVILDLKISLLYLQSHIPRDLRLSVSLP